MEKRKLGTSKIEVTPLIFGAWAIGGWKWGGTDKKEAIRAIHKAIDMGVNSIDTAPAYGFGLSEEIIGEALKGKRDRINIFNKCGLRWDVQKGEFFYEAKDFEGRSFKMYRYSGKEGIVEECERSLKRLKTDYIDLYQIHWPDSTTPIEESMEAMEKLKKEGKIRAIGVSNYSLEQFKKAVKSAEVVSNQLPFSMVDRHIEEDIIPYYLENGYAILAYSPLQRGLLTGKVTPDYKFKDDDHRKDNPFFTIENRKKVLLLIDKIKPIAESHGITVAQLVINWTVHHPGITAALVGTRNVKQAEENFDSLKVELSDEEMDQINKWVYQTNLEVSY
ncbi:MAG: aldo/keto reductase [Spirochaetaceae bacterium]|nr:aldo/keto reductase [Spirochaetaceae bacterium]